MRSKVNLLPYGIKFEVVREYLSEIIIDTTMPENHFYMKLIFCIKHC